MQKAGDTSKPERLEGAARPAWWKECVEGKGQTGQRWWAQSI